MSTHNLCFGAKIRKLGNTHAYPSFAIYSYISGTFHGHVSLMSDIKAKWNDLG